MMVVRLENIFKIMKKLSLIHADDIIQTMFVPIGQLSEKAQEARNKDLKRCQENNTRKSSPIFTNEDIMHYMVVASDPYITSKRN